jgi:hypothetical protein
MFKKRATWLNDVFRETEPNWAEELEEEVISECRRFGRVVHSKLEKDSEVR